VRAINPECAQGKHGNCNDKAMCPDEYCNLIHYCRCPCHALPEGEIMAAPQPKESEMPPNSDGFCVCESVAYPAVDCGIKAHRDKARRRRNPAIGA
jgi:hypothetical protein